MGKTGSKLNSTPSFSQAKSVKTLPIGRHKNIPLCLTNKPAQDGDSQVSSVEKPSRFVENVIIIWLDATLDKQTETNKNLLSQVSRVSHLFQTFSNIEECYNFITSIKNEKIFFIVSGSLGPQITPRIQGFDQVNSIYIFCGNRANHEVWTKQYPKIRSIHTRIKELCEAIRTDINNFDKSLTSITLLSTVSMDKLTDSNKEFIYLQMIKRTILEINSDKKFRKEGIDYARQFYLNHEQQLHIIDTFEENYNLHAPIWWYTRRCFLYYMLRKAFAKRDFEVIFHLSFFIRDLYKDIRKAHVQTHSHQHSPISIYRATAMTLAQFEELEKCQGGVLAFDDFLLTTLEFNVAYRFANLLRSQSSTSVNIIFKIDIDPLLSSMPYIALNNLSYLSVTDSDILFAMNTVFRIEKVEKQQDRLYQVTLKAMTKKDEEIKNILDYMDEVTLGLSGWYKLGKLFMDMKQYDITETIYKHCYSETDEKDREERAFIQHELGHLHDLRNNLEESVSHYKQAIDIHLSHLPPVHPIYLSTRVNLASVLEKQGNFHGALQQYELALQIDKSDIPNTPAQFNNIGYILQRQGKHNEAQQKYDKAIEIILADYPSAQKLLADIYHNMAEMYYTINDYAKALSYYEKTLTIDHKVLPPNDPSLATTYFNLAATHEALKAHKKAIQFAEKALEVAEAAYIKDHPELAIYKNYLAQLQQKP